LQLTVRQSLTARDAAKPQRFIKLRLTARDAAKPQR
jgi:hypothetical protein